MTTEKIVELVVAILPSIITVITVIATIWKILKQFAEVKKDVVDMKCIEELKEELGKVIEENYELKSALAETLTKIDHVKRG